ncbi:Uncharacterised protein [uncultured archaeon]|nr:Uncharacterised protein [uncultured archaeon]
MYFTLINQSPCFKANCAVCQMSIIIKHTVFSILMNLKQSSNNVPRNIIILALAVSIILGMFRLIPFIILVWIVSIGYLIIYQYKGSSKNMVTRFVCLDCATIHQQSSCPKCGSKLKKFYSGKNQYGI